MSASQTPDADQERNDRHRDDIHQHAVPIVGDLVFFLAILLVFRQIVEQIGLAGAWNGSADNGPVDNGPFDKGPVGNGSVGNESVGQMLPWPKLQNRRRRPLVPGLGPLMRQFGTAVSHRNQRIRLSE